MKKKLDEKRLQDELTAHLGLAAADKGKAAAGEDCYSPDQLADIAANVCTEEQKEKALAHFAECQRCYDDWVAACFSLAAMDRTYSRPGFVLTFRNLSYIGSALAIAASVVLFLNISGDKDLRQAGPEVQVQMQDEAASLPAPAGAEVKSGKEPVQVVEGERAAEQPARSAADGARLEKTAASGVEESFSGGTVEQDAASGADQSIQMMSAKRQVMEAGPAPNQHLSDWLESVRQGCMAGNKDLAHWAELQRGGQALSETARGSGIRLLADEQLTLVVNITEELTRIERVDQIEASCERIQRLVAQAKEKE